MQDEGEEGEEDEEDGEEPAKGSVVVTCEPLNGKGDPKTVEQIHQRLEAMDARRVAG